MHHIHHGPPQLTRPCPSYRDSIGSAQASCFACLLCAAVRLPRPPPSLSLALCPPMPTHLTGIGLCFSSHPQTSDLISSSLGLACSGLCCQLLPLFSSLPSPLGVDFLFDLSCPVSASSSSSFVTTVVQLPLLGIHAPFFRPSLKSFFSSQPFLHLRFIVTTRGTSIAIPHHPTLQRQPPTTRFRDSYQFDRHESTTRPF